MNLNYWWMSDSDLANAWKQGAAIGAAGVKSAKENTGGGLLGGLTGKGKKTGAYEPVINPDAMTLYDAPGAGSMGTLDGILQDPTLMNMPTMALA